MQPKGWFLSYLFSSEQLMHLLQKNGQGTALNAPYTIIYLSLFLSVWEWICWRSSGKTTSIFKANNAIPSQNTVDVFALWCYEISWLSTHFANQPGEEKLEHCQDVNIYLPKEN